MKIWRIAFYIISIFPLLFIIPLLTFYFHTAYNTGHLPTYGNPDPKYSGLYNYYNPLIHITFSAWILSLLPWLIMLTVHFFIKEKEPLQKIKVWGALFHLASFITMLSVVFEWYVD